MTPSVPVTTAPERPRRRIRRGVHPLILALVWGFALLWLVPLFGALLTSLRSFEDLNTHGLWSIPRAFTLDNFSRAWVEAGANRFMLNSFIVTIPSLLGCVALASLCAYALVRFRFRFSRGLYLMFVAGMMLPFQMLLLPVFQLSNALHIYNSYLALILIHTAFQMGFCTFVLRNFMRTVPFSLFESAVIDGATEWVIYRRIALPLLLPGMAALMTLEFTWIFNDFLWALVLVQDTALKPITAGLANLSGQFTTDYPLVVAGSLIAMVPTLVVFFALQRYFIAGLTVGATKG